MTNLPVGTCWIEPGLYVECPKCGRTHLLDSGDGVYLPDEGWEMVCSGNGACGNEFWVTGTKDEP